MLIPGAGADGDIPVPEPAVREGLLGQGKTYSTTTRATRSCRTPTGRPGRTEPTAAGDRQVTVDDGHGHVRTYVYEQSTTRSSCPSSTRTATRSAASRSIRRASYVEGRNASGVGPPAGADAQAPPRGGRRPGRCAHRGQPRTAGRNWWLIARLAPVGALLVGAIGGGRCGRRPARPVVGRGAGASTRPRGRRTGPTAAGGRDELPISRQAVAKHLAAARRRRPRGVVAATGERRATGSLPSR